MSKPHAAPEGLLSVRLGVCTEAGVLVLCGNVSVPPRHTPVCQHSNAIATMCTLSSV